MWRGAAGLVSGTGRRPRLSHGTDSVGVGAPVTSLGVAEADQGLDRSPPGGTGAPETAGAPGEHEHYDHYDAAMVDRLDRGWGHVDRAINRRIVALLGDARRVLDVGCGFGSLTAALAESRRALGIDPLLFGLETARRRFPGARLICGSAEDLPLAEGSVDAAVLKDALHHLVDEASIERVFAELERCGVERIVVVDPNPNPILVAARRLLGHVDPVCHPRDAVELLTAAGYRVEASEYRVIFSLPLSGGYVGPVLAPRWKPLWTVLLAIENGIATLLGALGLARFVCWRYFLVAWRDGRGANQAGPSRANSAK